MHSSIGEIQEFLQAILHSIRSKQRYFRRLFCKIANIYSCVLINTQKPLFNFVILPEYSFNFDKNSKIPVHLPPSPSSVERPVPDYDFDQPEIVSRQRSLVDLNTKFLDEDKEVYPLPNVRRRRQNSEEEARLLSQSTFNRITETLGALNKVGSFFLNMTREVNGDREQHPDEMQLISSSSDVVKNTNKPTTLEQVSFFSTDATTTTSTPHQTVSDKFLTITKNVTNIEPLIKRVGTVQPPAKESKIDKQTLNEKIDMAALAEKKRKKHQAIASKKETVAPYTTISTTLAPGN